MAGARADWRSVLKADPIAWLLEPDNPGVRRLALMELLGKPAFDPAVKKAGREAMETGLLPKILAGQNPDGSWGAPGMFYRSKYKGTVWQLIVLAELGADGRDERIRRACESILAVSQDRERGGFSVDTSRKGGGGLPSMVVPCLTGNMVWSLIRLGRLDDPRVQAGIDWITRFQRFDDGDGPAAPPAPYERWRTCWGRHVCHMGAVKSLKALAAIPKTRRSADVRRTIEAGVEYLLIHRVFKRSRKPDVVSRPGWLRLGFPWMYQSDILEILGILTGLGVRDERMREAVDILLSKQDGDGRWALENTFNGRYLADIDHKGRPSKWVTVRAMAALKKWFGAPTPPPDGLGRNKKRPRPPALGSGEWGRETPMAGPKRSRGRR